MSQQRLVETNTPSSPAANALAPQERRRRRFDFLKRVLETRLTVPSLVVLSVVIVAAVLADVIAPFDPTFGDYTRVTEGPSSTHWLGTDDLGRDVLSRLIFGARVSLQVGLIAVGIAVGVGTTLGVVAGYVGGYTDEVIMRINDALQAFPSLVLALAITAALGPSASNAMIAIGVVSTPIMARLARGQTLTVRENDYVSAARTLGARPRRIVARHILPNVIAPIIVQATLLVAVAIIIEASLSFLGVGVRPPTPTWGGMLRTGQQYLGVAPWLGFVPGVAIFLTVLSFNFLGDGLRRALDPRLRSRGSG
jgi:peptide/nickel transport system permease protein